jgi:hypothetical protein
MAQIKNPQLPPVPIREQESKADWSGEIVPDRQRIIRLHTKRGKAKKPANFCPVFQRESDQRDRRLFSLPGKSLFDIGFPSMHQRIVALRESNTRDWGEHQLSRRNVPQCEKVRRLKE